MYYSSHDLCDQIRPSTIELVFHILLLVYIPLPDLLLSLHFLLTKSTASVSPTSTLLRTLFVTTNLGSALVLPYTFAAAECSRKAALASTSLTQTPSLIHHLPNILPILQAALIFITTLSSTFLYIFHIPPAEATITTTRQGVHISSGNKEPWTPSRRILLAGILPSLVVVPISILYILPAFSQDVAADPASGGAGLLYWFSVEAWSFSLNLSASALSVIQGVPQLRLAAKRLAASAPAAEAEGEEIIKAAAKAAAEAKRKAKGKNKVYGAILTPPTPSTPTTSTSGHRRTYNVNGITYEEYDGSSESSFRERAVKRRGNKFYTYSVLLSNLRWIWMAAMWTVWFGGRLYANINFYLPVMWLVGAQVYWNYLVIAGEELMLFWLVRGIRDEDVDAPPAKVQKAGDIGNRVSVVAEVESDDDDDDDNGGDLYSRSINGDKDKGKKVAIDAPAIHPRYTNGTNGVTNGVTNGANGPRTRLANKRLVRRATEGEAYAASGSGGGEYGMLPSERTALLGGVRWYESGGHGDGLPN